MTDTLLWQFVAGPQVDAAGDQAAAQPRLPADGQPEPPGAGRGLHHHRQARAALEQGDEITQ